MTARLIPIALTLLALCAPLALDGCGWLHGVGIVDQRTFDRTAGIPPQPPRPPAPPPGRPGPGPLITVAAGTPQSDWQGPLRDAVHAALARKANVLFELRQTVPAGNDLDASVKAAQRASQALLGPLAQAIVADGATPAQVEVSAASQRMPAGDRGGVQVYLH